MASYFLVSAYSVLLLYFYLNLPFPLLLLPQSCSVCIYSYLYLLRVDLCFRKGLWFVKFHGFTGPMLHHQCYWIMVPLHLPLYMVFQSLHSLIALLKLARGTFHLVPSGDLRLVCPCVHQKPSCLPVLSSAQMWIPCSSWSCQWVVHWGGSWGDLTM